MNINDLKKVQMELDNEIGFPVSFKNNELKYEQVTKDLVGLFGEIGEFSNIVKKINIKNERKDSYDLDFDLAEDLLKEELIDCFIYILRLSAILDVDIEMEVLDKINKNRVRYDKLKK
ncbi:hypothetical protein ACSMDK_09535 [Yersinia enterocolitica]|uniref:hypothetical protein n=1 Tax=Yersinia TaxID=629 RepID=UPI003AB8135A